MDFPIKNGGSFHSYVKLPEGKAQALKCAFNYRNTRHFRHHRLFATSYDLWHSKIRNKTRNNTLTQNRFNASKTIKNASKIIPTPSTVQIPKTRSNWNVVDTSSKIGKLKHSAFFMGVEIPGGGLATPFCSYKALSQPPYDQNGFLRSKKTQKKTYQNEAPTLSKPPTQRQCDFRCLYRCPNGPFC